MTRIWVNKANVHKESGDGGKRRSQYAREGLLKIEGIVNNKILEKTEELDFEVKTEVHVKNTSGKFKKTSQHIDDWGDDTLEKMLAIADSQYCHNSKYSVDILIEVKATCSGLTALAVSKQRSTPAPAAPVVEEASSPERGVPDVAPGGRNDRSSQMRQLASADSRLLAHQVRGNFIDELHRWWHCWDTGCHNHGNHCCVSQTERPGLHFNLTQPDIDSWGYNMQRAEAGVDCKIPPVFLKQRLYDRGPITRRNMASNRPTQASRTAQLNPTLLELQGKAAVSSLEDQISRQREREERREGRREQREDDKQRQDNEKEAQRRCAELYNQQPPHMQQ